MVLHFNVRLSNMLMSQVAIVYKLYQTYQTPVSSPVSVSRPVTSGDLESERGHSLYSLKREERDHSMNSLKTTMTDLDSHEIAETRTLGRKPLPRLKVGFDLSPKHLSVTPLMMNQSRTGPIGDKYSHKISLDQSEASDLELAEKWNFPRTFETQSLTLDTKYLSL